MNEDFLNAIAFRGAFEEDQESLYREERLKEIGII